MCVKGWQPKKVPSVLEYLVSQLANGGKEQISALLYEETPSPAFCLQ